MIGYFLQDYLPARFGEFPPNWLIHPPNGVNIDSLYSINSYPKQKLEIETARKIAATFTLESLDAEFPILIKHLGVFYYRQGGWLADYNLRNGIYSAEYIEAVRVKKDDNQSAGGNSLINVYDGAFPEFPNINKTRIFSQQITGLTDSLTRDLESYKITTSVVENNDYLDFDEILESGNLIEKAQKMATAMDLEVFADSRAFEEKLKIGYLLHVGSKMQYNWWQCVEYSFDIHKNIHKLKYVRRR